VKDPACPERIKTAEVALILGVSVRKVQAMAARAELPGGARIGNQWTFNEAKIREFIVEKERDIERRAANIRQSLSHRPTSHEAPPSERAIQKRYEEVTAQLMGKTVAEAKEAAPEETGVDGRRRRVHAENSGGPGVRLRKGKT
jgi:Helix-turn-helix domain